MRILISLLIISLSLPAWSVDQSGNYAIWGKGQKSCFRYLKEYSGDKSDAYREYLMGYLTAYNVAAPETYSISGNMDLDEIIAWLDDYCEANQMHALEQSLLEFIASHYENRSRMSPGSRGR